MYWLFLLLAVLCNTGGNLVLKRSTGSDLATGPLGLSLPLVAGMGLFAVNLLFYFRALQDIPIAVAYPILVGLSVGGIALGAFFWFGERVTLFHLLGMTLIIGGVVVLSFQRGPA